MIVSMLLLCAGISISAQNIQVKGTVLDEAGQPLIGAGVIDRQSRENGTVTDLDGRFSISVSPESVLEVSSLGFKTQLIPVQGRDIIDVILQPETTQLESAIAIGYGTSRKVDLTGSVAVVNMDELQETPVASVAQALQGRIAGADIISGSGEPGESADIQIRGSRSISAGNAPLIVVDGVLDAVTSLDDLNPSDIVSISVLKDVSSTSIYGSRGANGVILVTTDVKPDKKSRFKVTFKSTTGISHIAGRLDLMDATEYATWYNMVALQKNPSLASDPGRYPYPDPAALGKGTDWVDVLSQIGIYNNQYVQISGGNGRTNILASAGYLYNKGVVIGQNHTRYSFRTNVDSKLNKWLKLGVRMSLMYHDVDRTSAKVSGTNTNAAIFITPVLGEDSIWNRYSFEDAQGIVFNNPYKSATSITNKADKWNLNISPWVKIDFTKNLSLNSNFTFTRDNNLTYYYSPSYMPVAAARKQGGTASRTVFEQLRFLSETTLNYSTKIRKSHMIEALVGFTASRQTRDNSYVTGTGYINDSAMYHKMEGIFDTANYHATSDNSIKTTMSVLGRVNYNWKRRYYLTMTARADGASNFSRNNKWGFFPSVAFRWSIMNEPWMSNAYWVNDLSLRVSAGRSGNDAISSYMSLATITSNKSSWLFNGKYLLATMPEHLANSSLTWETTDSYNIGFNFAGWRSRVILELDAYCSLTRDLLLNVKNSQVTGYDTYFDNMGRTRNIGIEVALTTTNIKSKNFEWATTLTVSHNNQVVIDSGAGDEVVPTYTNPRTSTQYLYGYRKGYPVNALWGYQFEGVWHNQAELDRNKVTHTYVSTIQDNTKGSNIGRSKYLDVNGDGMLDQNDMVYLGNSDPVIYGGFQNDFKIFRNLVLNVYFAYSLGGKMYNLSELYLGSSSASYNKYRYVLNAWHPTRNPDSDVPRADWDDYLGSDRQVHDASYLRLKSLTLSYRFNLKKHSKIFKSLNVGISGENLWLLKRYNGFDPDVSTSSTIRRLDNGSFPRPRTYTLNLQLNF